MWCGVKNIKMKLHLPEQIKELMQTILDAGFDCKIVGGYVRDSILGLEPNDVDLFTNCPGDKILELFPQGVVIGGEERQEKILTVVVDGVEISEFRLSSDRKTTGGNIEDHCATADFTINSLACDIDGRVFDYTGGMSDLHNKVLRFVGQADHRVSEDPLRAMRGIRFIAKYDLEPEAYAEDVLMNTWGFIHSLPVERIRDEFLKILEVDGGLQTLAKYRVLQPIIPELNHCMIEGGEHHDETVLEHLIYSYETAREITDDKRIWLAAFLHDIGKPKSIRYDEDGKIHFFQHHVIGADYVRGWMEYYKFSKHDIDFICTLIYEHMWLNRDTKPSKKSYIKHFSNLDKNNVSVLDFVKVMYCDNQGNMAKERVKFGDYEPVSELQKEYNKLKFEGTPFSVKDLEISGKDVMDIGGSEVSGPMIGFTLKYVYNEVMDGNIENSRPVLMNYLNKIFKDVKFLELQESCKEKLK